MISVTVALMTSPCVSAPPPSTLADCGFSLFSPPCLPLTPPPPPHPALLLLLLSVSMDENIETHTFLYFAYGSNLLKERLQLKNPSASIHCVTRLKVQPDLTIRRTWEDT